MSKKTAIATAVVVVVLTGCAPMPVAQQVEVTRIVEVTTTPVAEKATPTPSPTIAPSPTPDTRVFNIVARDIVPEPNELPDNGRWWLAEDTPHLNKEILAARGAVDGAAYLEESGRVGGWIRDFGRGTRTARVPEWVRFYPVVFKDSTGPIWLMNDDTRSEDQEDSVCDWIWEQGDAVEVDVEVGIGDVSFVCLAKQMQSNGKNYVNYNVTVIDKNVYAATSGWGYEDEFDLESVIDLAKVAHGLLQEAPLAETYTAAPIP